MIGTGDVTAMTAITRSLRTGFAATAPQPWDGTTAAAELAVQTGHLAQCIARQHGLDLRDFDDPARPIGDIGDELADVALAAFSITILSGDEKPLLPAGTCDSRGQASADVAQLLVLIIAAGRLAESAMVAGGYRHRPGGAMPAVPEAAGTVLAASDGLARLADLDLTAEFRKMAQDAGRFLASRGTTAGGDLP